MNRSGTYITSSKPTHTGKRASAGRGWRKCFNSLVFLSILFLIFSFISVKIGTAQPGQAGAPDSGTAGDSKLDAEGQPKPLEIDVDRPLTRPLRHSVSGMEPPAETVIEFNAGEGRPWSFVKFDQLPEHTSIIVRGDPKPYQKSESLKDGTWYPFKQKLPVNFKIDRNAKAPVQLRFWFGYPNELDERFLANQSPEKVRELASAYVQEKTNVQELAFHWGSSVVSVETTAVSFGADEALRKTVTLKGDPKLWTIVRSPQLADGIQLSLTASSPEILTSGLNTQLKAGEWIGFKGSAFLDIELNLSELKPDANSATVHIETAIARSPGQTKESVIDEINAGTITSNGSIPFVVSWESAGGVSLLKIFGIVAIVIVVAAVAVGLWILVNKSPKGKPVVQRTANGVVVSDSGSSKKHRHHNRDGSGESKGRGSTLGINSGPTPGASSQGPARSVAPSSAQTTSQSIHSGASINDYPPVQNENLEQLKDELQELRDELKTHIDQSQRNFVTPEYVNEQLLDFQKRIANSFREGLENLRSESQQEVSSRLEKNQKGTEKEISDLYLLLDQISKENIERTQNAETRITNQLDQLQKMLSEQAFPESYFARTMGMILSKNIDDLHEGKLERLMGECINHFFQAEAPRGESLDDLRQRSESIVTALKQVVEIISRKKPDVEQEARLRVGRAETLLGKISSVQTQLQSRNLIIETTLRIPVSAYSGARQTFLEELGRGIRSEIDKLGDPQSYFEGDLERLVTADLVAIVDICDKKVSSPLGLDLELESALKQLFMHAGLRPIVPSPGEPFGTAEQDLVQMVPGAAGTNMTIAEVVTRGFYYTRRDTETLLRKPGVTVYR